MAIRTILTDEDPALHKVCHPVTKFDDKLGRLLDDFPRPGAVGGPEELFRVQYLVGMLKVQAQAGQQTSQSASQGMESLLRQQG